MNVESEVWTSHFRLSLRNIYHRRCPVKTPENDVKPEEIRSSTELYYVIRTGQNFKKGKKRHRDVTNM